MLRRRTRAQDLGTANKTQAGMPGMTLARHGRGAALSKQGHCDPAPLVQICASTIAGAAGSMPKPLYHSWQQGGPLEMPAPPCRSVSRRLPPCKGSRATCLMASCAVTGASGSSPFRLLVTVASLPAKPSAPDTGRLSQAGTRASGLGGPARDGKRSAVSATLAVVLSRHGVPHP